MKNLGFSVLSLLAAIELACSGCSLLFTTKPPPNPELLLPGEPVECTSSRAAPIVDTIVGALEVVRTGVAATANDSVYQNATIDRGTDIALGTVLTALFVGSAIYGYSITESCSTIKDGHLGRLGVGTETPHYRAAPYPQRPALPPPAATPPATPASDGGADAPAPPTSPANAAPVGSAVPTR